MTRMMLRRLFLKGVKIVEEIKPRAWYRKLNFSCMWADTHKGLALKLPPQELVDHSSSSHFTSVLVSINDPKSNKSQQKRRIPCCITGMIDLNTRAYSRLLSVNNHSQRQAACTTSIKHNMIFLKKEAEIWRCYLTHYQAKRTYPL